MTIRPVSAELFHVDAQTHDVAGLRPATSWVHYTTSCNTQSSAPEDGQNNFPKHAELTGIINKPFSLSILFISMMHGQANIR